MRQPRVIRWQKGASAIAILIGVAILISVVTLLLRLGPHYIDWQTMKSIIEELPAQQMNTMSPDDIREALRKRFKINSLRDFDLKKIITVDRSKKAGTTLIVEYEQREHLIGNVDAVLTFREQYTYQ